METSNISLALKFTHPLDFRFNVHDVDESICLNAPGFYLSTCVDINVQYLVVNAILQVRVNVHSGFQSFVPSLPFNS